MKPTAPLAAILLSITLAPAHALVIHPDIWFSSDNGNIQCGGYSQYSSSIVCAIYQRQDNIQPHTARPEACAASPMCCGWARLHCQGSLKMARQPEI